MDDPLTKIFNPEVNEKLDSIVSKSEVLQFRFGFDFRKTGSILIAIPIARQHARLS